MNKRTKVIIGVVVVAVAGYLIYRWYQNRQATSDGTDSGVLGSNLNSVAPELVGGSSGPSVGPAVAMPLTINLSESATKTADDDDRDRDRDMEREDHDRDDRPHHRQRHAAAKMSDARGGPGKGGITGGHEPTIPLNNNPHIPFDEEGLDDVMPELGTGQGNPGGGFTMDNSSPNSFTQGAY